MVICAGTPERDMLPGGGDSTRAARAAARVVPAAGSPPPSGRRCALGPHTRECRYIRGQRTLRPLHRWLLAALGSTLRAADRAANWYMSHDQFCAKADAFPDDLQVLYFAARITLRLSALTELSDVLDAAVMLLRRLEGAISIDSASLSYTAQTVPLPPHHAATLSAFDTSRRQPEDARLWAEIVEMLWRSAMSDASARAGAAWTALTARLMALRASVPLDITDPVIVTAEWARRCALASVAE